MRVQPGDRRQRQKRAAQGRRLCRRRVEMFVAPPGGMGRAQAVDAQKDHPAPAQDGQKGGHLFGGKADPRHPGADQDRVGDRAEKDDRQHMFPPEPLPQHEDILRADGGDQAEGQAEAGKKDGQHGGNSLVAGLD